MREALRDAGGEHAAPHALVARLGRTAARRVRRPVTAKPNKQRILIAQPAAREKLLLGEYFGVRNDFAVDRELQLEPGGPAPDLCTWPLGMRLTN